MPETIPDVLDVMGLSRKDVIDRLLHFPGTFDMDFTIDYLHTLSDDQLHHVLMAAYLHACRAKKL